MKENIKSELDIFCTILNRLNKDGLVYTYNPQNEDDLEIALDKVIEAALLVNRNMYFKVHTANDEKIYMWVGKALVSKKLLDSKVEFIIKDSNTLEIYLKED